MASGRMGGLGKIGVLTLGCLMAAGASARAEPGIALRLLVDGLDSPLFVTHAGDGSGRLFVVEQAGRILIFDDGALLERPFLDLGDQVPTGGERGLLGLAFHPDFATQRPLLRRLHARAGRRDRDRGVPPSPRRPRTAPSPQQRVLLTVAQPFANHNGGMLAFGPDGYLYIGLGDGGSGGDPGNRAQNPERAARQDPAHRRRRRRSPTRSRRTTRSPAAAAGPRSARSACAIRGASRSTGDNGRLCIGDVGQDASRRSTSSGAAATTAGGSWRAAPATARPAAASGRG